MAIVVPFTNLGKEDIRIRLSRSHPGPNGIRRSGAIHGNARVIANEVAAPKEGVVKVGSEIGHPDLLETQSSIERARNEGLGQFVVWIETPVVKDYIHSTAGAGGKKRLELVTRRTRRFWAN